MLKGVGWILMALIAVPIHTFASVSCDSQELHSEKRSTFIEQMVAGLSLMDADSGNRFLTRNGSGHVVELYGFMTISFLSSNGSEMLEIIRPPGAERTAFAEFRVRKVTMDEETTAPRVAIRTFKSGRGVSIGMEEKAVLDVLGKPTEKDTEGAVEKYVYRCADQRSCPVLRAINMPIYKGIYIFHNSRLIEMRCGFPYP